MERCFLRGMGRESEEDPKNVWICSQGRSREGGVTGSVRNANTVIPTPTSLTCTHEWHVRQSCELFMMPP